MRLLTGAIPLFFLAWSCTVSAAEHPEGYRQILPRGQIASVDAPRWVPAQQAQLSDNALVFGVVIAGHPRAFSLNLLNSREIVNDAVGTTAYSAVW